MARFSYLVALHLFSAAVCAQGLAGSKNIDRAFLFRAGYGVMSSAGDLADRFGGGFALEGGVDYLPEGSNWQYGLMTHYGFGNEVREDVLAGIRTDAGDIIGNQRQPATIRQRQRQLFVGGRVGRTLYLGGKNPRAGLQMAGGLGYFYSRIRFQDDPSQYVPQLDRPIQAAYDKLAGGPAGYVFLGYQQLGLDRGLNFFAGGEMIAAATRPLRSYDAALGSPPPDEGRLDVVLGARIGIILPIYRGQGEAIFY